MVRPLRENSWKAVSRMGDLLRTHVPVRISARYDLIFIIISSNISCIKFPIHQNYKIHRWRHLYLFLTLPFPTEILWHTQPLSHLELHPDLPPAYVSLYKAARAGPITRLMHLIFSSRWSRDTFDGFWLDNIIFSDGLRRAPPWIRVVILNTSSSKNQSGANSTGLMFPLWLTLPLLQAPGSF